MIQSRRRVLTHSLFAVLVSSCAHLANAQERTPPASDQAPEITTRGVGTRRIPANRASIDLVIETRAPEASAAAAANARIVAAVRDTLRRMGLDSAVASTTYNINPTFGIPQMPGGERVRTGYAARSVLRVNLSRLEAVGRVIDAALASGATGVQGVAFESSATDAARHEAIALAAAAARQDAEALARAYGGTLGALLGTTTTPAGFDPVIPARRELVGDFEFQTQLVPREIVVSAVVTTRWRFVPGR